MDTQQDKVIDFPGHAWPRPDASRVSHYPTSEVDGRRRVHDLDFAGVRLIVGKAVMNNPGIDLFTFTLSFPADGASKIDWIQSREWIETADGQLMMPYHDGSADELALALAAYSEEVASGRRPQELVLSVHRDGWFSFHSEHEIDMGLEKSAFVAAKKKLQEGG